MNKYPSESRRSFTRQFKKDLVERALASNESNAVIARKHEINANQLAIWIKQYREGAGWASPGIERPVDEPALIPVTLADTSQVVEGTRLSESCGLVSATLSFPSGRQLEFKNMNAGALMTLLEVVS